MTDKPKTTAPATPPATQTKTPAAVPPAKQLKPIEEVRSVIQTLAPQFKMALPGHISVEKFQRVAITAINQNPELLAADRSSLYGACMKAAQDGLLPDGREAALVIFNTKQGDVWVKKVQYMPMVAGILKKIRNSGELKELSVHVVFKNDFFEYFIDDDGEHLKHIPEIDGERGEFRLVYAVATTLEAGRYVEVMTKGQVEEVRAISKSKDKGPWVDWYPEMARKTVIRRLSKRLPMSTDIDELLRRDDDLYDLNAARDPAPAAVVVEPTDSQPRRPRRLQAVVDAEKTPPAKAPANEKSTPADDEPPAGHPAGESPPDQQQPGDASDRI
jgi:recombination protein RecT